MSSCKAFSCLLDVVFRSILIYIPQFFAYGGVPGGLAAGVFGGVLGDPGIMDETNGFDLG